jgi:hypothetical protein
VIHTNNLQSLTPQIQKIIQATVLQRGNNGERKLAETSGKSTR